MRDDLPADVRLLGAAINDQCAVSEQGFGGGPGTQGAEGKRESIRKKPRQLGWTAYIIYGGLGNSVHI